MRRLRLATLALASGVLATLSGCTSTSSTSCNSSSSMFPRLFSGNMFGRSTPEHVSEYMPDCDCHHSYMPPVTNLGTVQSPYMMPSAGMPSSGMPMGGMPMGGMPVSGMPASAIPITNAPGGTMPPNIMRVPQAQSTPYSPAPMLTN